MTGRCESASDISSAISVQARTTASQPRAPSFSMTAPVGPARLFFELAANQLVEDYGVDPFAIGRVRYFTGHIMRGEPRRVDRAFQ